MSILPPSKWSKAVRAEDLFNHNLDAEYIWV